MLGAVAEHKPLGLLGNRWGMPGAVATGGISWLVSITDDQSNPLVEVTQNPFIEHVVDSFEDFCLDGFVISVGHIGE